MSDNRSSVLYPFFLINTSSLRVKDLLNWGKSGD